MTDFERRLRAAMASAAEPPPAGLLDGIRRRHRRHLRRVGAASLAAVAAVGIVVPLATRGVLASSVTPAVTRPAVPAAAPAAAPGTVRRDCQDSEGGTVSSNWQAESVHAGPVWFIFMRPKATGQRLVTGKLTQSAMVIAISNGDTATVTAGSATRGHYRFLAQFNSDASPYTLAEGAPSLVLTGCPATPIGTNIPASYAPGLTMFWEGYVTDLRGCIPLQVRTSSVRPPVSVVVSGPDGSCLPASQAVLVGEDHCLHPVAQTELGQQPGDMGLDGGLGDQERGRDLGVRQPGGQ